MLKHPKKGLFGSQNRFEWLRRGKYGSSKQPKYTKERNPTKQYWHAYLEQTYEYDGFLVNESVVSGNEKKNPFSEGSFTS